MPHLLRPIALVALSGSMLACFCGGVLPTSRLPSEHSGDSFDGCGDSCVQPEDTGPCGQPYSGPTTLGISDCLPHAVDDAIVIDCDESDWWFDIYTVGWAAGGEVFIYETGADQPWDEQHSLVVYDSSDVGHWDNLYIDLEIVETFDRVESGETTLYDCTDAQAARLTWHIVVHEIDGGEVCAVLGHDPESLGTGCEVWN